MILAVFTAIHNAIAIARKSLTIQKITVKTNFDGRGQKSGNRVRKQKSDVASSGVPGETYWRVSTNPAAEPVGSTIHFVRILVATRTIAAR